MAVIFKCKMCGGDLNIEEGATICECEYCGTKQTLPKLGDDRRANLYDRANHFRRNNEFDKASGIYEQILNDDNTDCEAYWSLVLCRYGIEYVEDPATHKRVPTVNRAQFTSIFDDDNYKLALEYADSYQKSIYEEEAAAINEIQKGILAISQQEEPFDIFICYKETDNNGRRTQDSVLANDLYHQLTNEGFKVFFARITLEDKLGTAYEPYIFAALNSAKVMVVLGTKPEYFNAVWVKNEWSRYLALVKQSGGKKILIPAYRDMDPYDLPEEFSHLQAQDMGKLGFMQDLIRGIKKLTASDEPKTVTKETVVVNNAAAASVEPLLKRAFMFLEDGDFARADDFCEQALNQDPENATAYLGKLMVELKCRRKESLRDCEQPFDDNANYKKVVRFGDAGIIEQLNQYLDTIHKRLELEEQKRREFLYGKTKASMTVTASINEFEDAKHIFEGMIEYERSADLAAACDECIDIKQKIQDFDKSVKKSANEEQQIQQEIDRLDHAAKEEIKLQRHTMRKSNRTAYGLVLLSCAIIISIATIVIFTKYATIISVALLSVVMIIPILALFFAGSITFVNGYRYNRTIDIRIKESNSLISKYNRDKEIAMEKRDVIQKCKIKDKSELASLEAALSQILDRAKTL